MRYYIEVGTINKAKVDIETIAARLGYVNLTRFNFGKGGAALDPGQFVEIINAANQE